MHLMNFITLLGGLGLFLFGIHYMGDAIENFASDKLRRMLQKLTGTPFKAFTTGLAVTTIVQSSSAVTIMVMSFLGAGMMTLAQATGVIFGANIGTTITAVLIAADVSAIAPVCIFIGVFVFLFSKKPGTQYIGQMILGFGILFFGLKTMSGDDAMGALSQSAAFKGFIADSASPAAAMLIGILFCAVIQSSSAAVGVLQVVSLTGFLPIETAFFLIIGINIGSAAPLFISCLGAKPVAKQAAVIYFLFDCIGALVFVPLNLLTPLSGWIAALPLGPSGQVAACHILFKVVTALLLLPLVKPISRLVVRLVPEKGQGRKRKMPAAASANKAF